MGPIDRNVQPALEGSRINDSTLAASASDLQPQDVSASDSFWLARARDAYSGGKDWFDQSIRPRVEANLAHFNTKHAPGSKYYSELFRKKSRSFVPRTRSMVRRTEAAAAIAFFSTEDLVNVKPVNESIPLQVDAAEVHNALANYRLEETIPWFQLVMGAIQDASNAGVVISRQEWVYETREREELLVYETETGELVGEYETVQDVITDEPRITLVPVENLIIDPACDWLDPINSSPYLIELIPMYAKDIQAKMDEINPRTGLPVYRFMQLSMLAAAMSQDWDSIRRMRDGERIDKYDVINHVNAYQIIWVRRTFVREEGEDWFFDTLGSEMMLSEPELTTDVFPHLKPGRRPYSMGTLSVEAHKTYPMSPVEMSSPTQKDINEIRNLRLDNVKLGLNKRYFVARGQQVDLTALMRNIPGSAVMMSRTDSVKETQASDVTSGAYQEQDRMNLEFDEVSGSFSAASVGSNRQMNETVGGMTLLSADASQIKEYEIRTISETWVEDVLRQLVAMEAMYESNQEILETVAATSSMPMDRVLAALEQPVRVSCRVGFNSTSPERRMAKIMLAIETLVKLDPTGSFLQGLDKAELAREIFGAVGYRDGRRFAPNLGEDAEQDPMVQQLQQQVAELQAVIEQKQIEQQGKAQIAQMQGEYRLAGIQMQTGMAAQLGMARLQIEAEKAGLKAQLDQVQAQLKSATTEIDRNRLFLEREALSHSIQDKDREFMLKVGQMLRQQEPTGVPSTSGAQDLRGNDRAGVISRDRYGMIPQMAG